VPEGEFVRGLRVLLALMRKVGLLVAAAVMAAAVGPFRALALPDETSPADGAPVVADTRAFLEEVKANLRSDSALLEQYTFIETYTERRLDGKGTVKKALVETYEVYPSVEPRKLYRRLVARDGQPLSEKELAERDRKQEAKIARREQRLAAENEAARAKREEESQRKERAVIDEVWLMDEFRIVAREVVDGRPTIVIEFEPRPGFKPVTEGGKVIQKFAGRAWVDEQDRQLVRLETRLVDSLGVGPARVARLQKGSTAYFQRRKINGEIWLPAEARFTGKARVLLVFGGGLDVIARYDDYRKFSVGTDEDMIVDPAEEAAGSPPGN
jgi:hypothetical protein